MQTTLTDRQERFIYEFLIDQNASAAARRCGYGAKNAAWQGSALLRMPEVRARIRTELQNIFAELGVSLRDLVRERAKAIHFRAIKMFDAEGRLLPLREMDADTRDVLEITYRLRKGEPDICLRPPNREAAFRAMEKLNERIDKENAAEGEREYHESIRAEDARRERQARRHGEQARPNPAPDLDEYPQKPVVLSGHGTMEGGSGRARAALPDPENAVKPVDLPGRRPARRKWWGGLRQ